MAYAMALEAETYALEEEAGARVGSAHPGPLIGPTRRLGQSR
jgi:hypothetical protein